MFSLYTIPSRHTHAKVVQDAKGGRDNAAKRNHVGIHTDNTLCYVATSMVISVFVWPSNKESRRYKAHLQFHHLCHSFILLIFGMDKHDSKLQGGGMSSYSDMNKLPASHHRLNTKTNANVIIYHKPCIISVFPSTANRALLARMQGLFFLA